MLNTLIKLFFFKSIKMNPPNAPNTKRMQEMNHAEIAVRPSTFGDSFVISTKLLSKTRKIVNNKANRPETASGGIKKLAYEKNTK